MPVSPSEDMTKHHFAQQTWAESETGRSAAPGGARDHFTRAVVPSCTVICFGLSCVPSLWVTRTM